MRRKLLAAVLVVAAVAFAVPLEHFFMEPEPDQVYRRMLELARA